MLVVNETADVNFASSRMLNLQAAALANLTCCCLQNLNPAVFLQLRGDVTGLERES